MLKLALQIPRIIVLMNRNVRMERFPTFPTKIPPCSRGKKKWQKPQPAQNNSRLNCQFYHVCSSESLRGRRSRARIDFVRTGEIGGCFTAHLAETVEDVKTIKEDNPARFRNWRFVLLFFFLFLFPSDEKRKKERNRREEESTKKKERRRGGEKKETLQEHEEQ